MSTIALTNQAQLSGDKATQGLQMTEQFMGLAHPINSQVRDKFTLRSHTRNTPALQELFIDGLLNYRFKGISDSTGILSGEVVYNSNITANCAVFVVTAAYRVLNGVLTFVGTPTLTKIGTSAAVLAAVANTPAGTVSFNATGVGGDTLANWIGSLEITESTDFPG